MVQPCPSSPQTPEQSHSPCVFPPGSLPLSHVSLSFRFPRLPDLQRRAEEVFEECPDAPNLVLTDHQWAKVQEQAYFKQHPGARLLDPQALTQTLQSSYRSGYLLYTQFVPCPSTNPRFFSPRECARLMGFPEAYLLHLSGEAAPLARQRVGRLYRQIGNAVCPPVIAAIVQCIVPHLHVGLDPAQVPQGAPGSEGAVQQLEPQLSAALSLVLDSLAPQQRAELQQRHSHIFQSVSHSTLSKPSDMSKMHKPM